MGALGKLSHSAVEMSEWGLEIFMWIAAALYCVEQLFVASKLSTRGGAVVYAVWT